MIRRFIIVLLCLALASGGSCSEAVRAETSEVEQVILVLWHGLDWSHVEDLRFDAPVGLGLLNTRGGGGDLLSAAYLTLGAGARTVGWSGSAAFYGDEALGKELYKRHTGLEPTTMVQPQIAKIHAAQNVSYRLAPGALGTAFAEAGVPLRVLGNSDGAERYSWAALVGMDTWGRVWQGSVGREFLILDPSYPYGMRTDYDRLYSEVVQAREPLVVVDLGDPFRFDQYKSQLLPAQKERLDNALATEARRFLEKVVENRSPQTMVFLVSPHPSQELASRGFWLTPTLLWGQQEGLLTSGTTRWPGLITNMDVAPTILAALEIDHNQPLIGRPVSIEPSTWDEATEWLETMGEKLGSLSKNRGGALRALVICQILTYTVVLISLIAGVEVRMLQLALLVLMLVPLGLLLWDQAPLVVLVLGIAMAILRWRRTQSTRLVGAIAMTTVLAITLDIFLGSWLMRYSFLGYDPIGGARFYGIGNEFMGVLVGFSIMAWAIWVEERPLPSTWRNVLGLLLFGILTVVIGAPSLGTNVGGAISAVFGFGATWLALAGKKLNLRTMVLLIVVTLAVLGTLMAIDGANSQGEQSHIGQTVELVRRDGLGAMFLIITRKLAMNIKLLRYSMWSNALIVALVGMGASFVWPSKYICWLKENHPVIAKGLVGVVMGSTAAFVFNDSGVVAAATCLSIASSTLLLLAVESKHDLASPQSYVEDDGHSD